MKVSYLVLAQRNDLYIQARPWAADPEPEKKPHEKGKYLMPELYGKPAEMGIFYRKFPQRKEGRIVHLDRKDLKAPARPALPTSRLTGIE